MARRLRVSSAGVSEHLIQRGNNRQSTFACEEWDRGSSCLINKTMGSTLYVCQDLNELNMKMLFTM
jgi:hypothetical protein